MVDAMRSPSSVDELAALGRADGRSAMLSASVTDRLREATGAPEPGSAGRRRSVAAQTRQIAHRAREIVASTII
jgi:hypothetical protein